MLENSQSPWNRQPEDSRRGNLRSPWLGFGLAAALALTLAFSWLGYSRLHHEPAVEATAKPDDGVQKTVDGLGDRMKTIDAELQRSSGDRQGMLDRVNVLEHRLVALLSQQQRQLKEASTGMLRAAQADASNKIAAMQTRLARLESSGVTADNRVGELQRELGQVHREMAGQAGELHSVRRELQAERLNTDRQLAALRRGEAGDRKDVTALADKLTRRRVDFEVTKNRAQELAPGITLTLTGTDVSYRRVKGFLWLMPDRRALWLRKDSAQKPVIFYGYEDGAERELIFTNVTDHSATGYLLLPKDGAASELATAHQTE